MARQVELTGVEVANLRGFREAYLPLRDGLTLLVGPNNSGKTSILRLLDWVLNRASEETVLGDRLLTPEELQLLLPARETRNAARRLILWVRVLDGRRRTRFQCDGEVAGLRLGLRLPGVLRLNLGPPRRNETSDYDSALVLLRELRQDVDFSLVPASRDARSDSFRASFRQAVFGKLEERAVHSGRAGSPSEYRVVKRSLDQIREVADNLVLPLWDEVKPSLPPGIAHGATMEADVDPAALIGWIADRTGLRLTTGAHDVATVQPEEVGSGLQSLLELALQQSRAGRDDADRVVAVEEPEAFLHPAAQRTLARMISEESPGKRLVSTHSPILVDEARFGETILVRDHRFFPPAEVADETRNAINSALLAGHGAEMAFSRSVLLVEGPGDRLFYETLRRRLARASRDGVLDHLSVVPAGSKAAFGPWLTLLSSYGTEGDRPIQWLVAADGDAAVAVRRAHRDAGLRLPMLVRQALLRAGTERRQGSDEAFVAATEEANRECRRAGVPLHLSPIDLEHAVLDGCSDDTAAELADELGLEVANRVDLEAALRSRKAPHLRAALANLLPWDELSADTIAVLRGWMRAVMPTNAVTRLLRSGAPPVT